MELGQLQGRSENDPHEQENDEEMDVDEPFELQHLQDGEQQVDEQLPDMLTGLFSQLNVRMLISNEERRRALNIKAAIEACEDLEPISDMMCVQFAIKDGDDVDCAVQRARHLQTFRREYGIADEYEEGCEISKGFLKQHPGHILSIAYNALEGNYVIIYDQANFTDSVLKFDEQWRTMLGYGWYLYHALNPDIHAIR